VAGSENFQARSVAHRGADREERIGCLVSDPTAEAFASTISDVHSLPHNRRPLAGKTQDRARPRLTAL